MGRQLSPELEHLGDTLTEATARAAGARRHRVQVARRTLACLTVGLVVFAARPTHLGPAQSPDLLGLQDAYASAHQDPCDPPHGTAADCRVEDPPPQVR